MDEKKNIISLYDYVQNKTTVTPFEQYNSFKKLEVDNIFSKRVWAFIIDMMTIIVMKSAIDVAYALFIRNFYFVLNIDQQNYLSFGHWGLQWSVTMSIFLTYFIYCHYSLEGKTFGKMAMKIRTINDKFLQQQDYMDYTPTLRQALQRTLGYFVCYISFGTFFSFPLFSEDKRGVPDYLSSTRTVSDEWLKGMMDYKTYDSHQIFIDTASLDEAA